MIGYYIDQKIEISKVTKKQLCGGVLAAVAGIAISCLVTYREGILTGTFTQNYVQLFDYVSAIVLFLLIKHTVLKRTARKVTAETGNERKRLQIHHIGALTLGIYLLDPFLKEIIYNPYARLAERFIPVLICSLGWVVISMAAGGAITWVLKKIPGLSRLL